MRIGHLKEVTFDDIVAFAITCLWIVVMVIGRILWLPKEILVWAVKNLWQAGIIAGGVYGLWKLGVLIFNVWFGMED